ncbi:unnamed protein product [Closterium sp. NIES-54]
MLSLEMWKVKYGPVSGRTQVHPPIGTLTTTFLLLTKDDELADEDVEAFPPSPPPPIPTTPPQVADLLVLTPLSTTGDEGRLEASSTGEQQTREQVQKRAAENPPTRERQTGKSTGKVLTKTKSASGLTSGEQPIEVSECCSASICVGYSGVAHKGYDPIRWLTRNAAGCLAIRNHQLLAKCAHFGQHRTAQALYDAVVAHYSSPATTALGRLQLPYLFPELSTFATLEDLVLLVALRARPSFRGAPRPPLPPPTPLLLLLTSLVLRMSGLLLLVRSAAAARARVAGMVEVAAGVVVGAAVEVVEAVEVVAAVGVVAGEGALVAAVEVAVGVAVVATVGVVAVGLELSMEVLEEARGRGSSDERYPVTPAASSGVAIFDLDYDSILSAMYAFSASAEGDCYRCVPPDPGIAATALGASESSLPGTAPAEALHTFTLDSGASRCFFHDSTTLTPLPAPLPVRLADPSGAQSLPVPPLFSRVRRTAALQDSMVTTTTSGGQRVSICTCTRTGPHLATFTCWPGSSLYTLATEPPQVAASAQVSASGQIAPPCSCRLLSHQTLLWHHRLGHPPEDPTPSGVSQVDPLPGVVPVEVAGDSGAARGAASGGVGPGCAEPGGAESERATFGGAEPGGAEPEGAEPAGVANRGAEPEGVELGVLGLRVQSLGPLSPQKLCEWLVRRARLRSGAAGARTGGAGVTTGAGGAGGAAAAGPRGARTRAGGTAAGGTGVGGTCAGGAGAGGTGAGGARAGGAGAVDPGGTVRPRPARAASPNVSRLLATAVSDPSFESAAASALVAELLDFAAACRLDYATARLAESASACPPSVGGECALGKIVLEDKQEDFEYLAAALPRFPSMQLAPEGDPDAPDIPTLRSYAEAITSPYSSHWQAAMYAEMASWKSTGTYVDEVPPPGANIVDGMLIFREKWPPGSAPAFKARYVARRFSQRQGVDNFQTFSPTPKMTSLRVLLHVAAQRDYELHSLDFSTAFMQGSLHEEIWLCRPPGFTWLFSAGTQWSLRWPVYGLRQAPREWHDTLRTTLAALGFAPSTADTSLFLRIDTSLPPFYVLVYADHLVFATADTEALTLVKSELQKRHTCTDLGELRSYLGLQITRDRARCTITLTQSHMVH